MSSAPQQANEERKPPENAAINTLTLKAVTYEEAKRLGDAICVKYKKAFDLLKDK